MNPKVSAENELFVKIVEKHLSLYDIQDVKDQIVKDKAWKEITEVSGRLAEDCKKQWRNIKDTCNRRKKKGKGTGSAATTKPVKWALADMLSFLDKVEHKRPSISSATGESHNDIDQDEDVYVENNSESEDVSEESSRLNTEDNRNISNGGSTSRIGKQQSDRPSRCPPSKREKLNANIISVMRERSLEKSKILKQTGQNKADSVDLFFQSIAISVKSLRPDLINEAQMRTLRLLFELEQRNACEPSPPSPPLQSASSSGNTSSDSPSPWWRPFRW